MNRKFALLAALMAVGLVFAAAPAAAYIGPGAGLSLLGALWGVLAAVFAALLFMVLWPLRRLSRRRRGAAATKAAAQDEAGMPRTDSGTAPGE